MGKKAIPEYFYPLYKAEDAKAYQLLRKLAQTRNYPLFAASQKDKDKFIKLLVYSGKAKDWRIFGDQVISQLSRGKLDLKTLIAFGQGIDIPRGIDKSWAIFTQDQRICLLLDDFYQHPVSFVGSDDEFFEFILRYLLSQLIQDWRGPKLAVVVTSLKTNRIPLRKLNQLLSHWDFLSTLERHPS